MSLLISCVKFLIISLNLSLRASSLTIGDPEAVLFLDRLSEALAEAGDERLFGLLLGHLLVFEVQPLEP
jgi:hypothetical protein